MFKHLHLNRIILIGQVNEKPILRYVPSGSPVCTFSIKVLREKPDSSIQEGEYDLFPVIAWKEQALYCHHSVEKGGWVYCEGSLQIRPLEDHPSHKRNEIEVIVKDIFCLQQ